MWLTIGRIQEIISTSLLQRWVFLLVATILGLTYLLYHFRQRRLYPEENWDKRRYMVKHIIYGFLIVAIPLWALTLGLQNISIGVLFTIIILLVMMSVIAGVKVRRYTWTLEILLLTCLVEESLQSLIFKREEWSVLYYFCYLDWLWL
jgi:hypothetical protein